MTDRKNIDNTDDDNTYKDDWYKDAIIYELNMRGFKDSNADGKGDIKGLISKLDYLEELGINCIWLLPIYPSPLKDDGYDISDYYGIHSDFGSLDDFRQLINEAHNREIKIIGELVLNHTSDQHFWFQEAKKGRDNEYHDYFVWSDTDEKYNDARIIFVDSEKSNWTWSHDCKRYYWHRFFYNQPDLNFDNPKVREEMKRVIDFWFMIGLDGLRVDAVPYLFEREGTNCENLPETHSYMKEIRAYIDKNHKGKMLLAEANQWPEDLIPYFGNNDEFHMAYNFPLMPRMFMALKQEHHGPIVDIIKRTPDIPAGCQWAIFLRNHDELTLEMCTDEERDYMYKSYAKDKQMKINVGIRRRLAPLLDNDRRKVELLNTMLLTLAGTPILYYGDEIGMGDNVYLGDRNGVRTPMQWNENKNAGFSDCPPSKLYAPVIIDPEYNYHSINVESQQNNENSLLNFIKRLIRIRKEHTVFGRGTLEFIYPENKKVLVYLRKMEGANTILCIFNLSSRAQPAEIYLEDFKGMTPLELFGKTEFPAIGELPYYLTLSPYSYLLFELQ